MKRFLPLIMFLMAAPANADMIHKISSSVQLNVEGPAVQSTRIGSSYSVSGSNVSATLGGLTAPASATAAATMSSGTYTQTTAGDAFTFSESFNQGDAIVTTQTALSAGQIDQPNIYGNTTTQLGGTAGSLAGTIGSDGSMTLTAGGAGTTATGQFVTEITVR
jgi:hypothetical protein